jgi:hypothetical protein
MAMAMAAESFSKNQKNLRCWAFHWLAVLTVIGRQRWDHRQKQENPKQLSCLGFLFLAEWTGLEPATPGVTGRYSNQLNYHSW